MGNGVEATSENRNDKNFNQLIFWILGTVTLLALGASTSWLSTVQEQLRDVKSTQTQQQGKLASLEASQSQMSIWFPKLESKVDRIDDKISELIEDGYRVKLSDKSTKR